MEIYAAVEGAGFRISARTGFEWLRRRWRRHEQCAGSSDDPADVSKPADQSERPDLDHAAHISKFTFESE